MKGKKLSAVVNGDDQYKKYVFDTSKLENGGYEMIFEKSEDMKILTIVGPRSKVTIDGLRSKPELNGREITLGKFNIKKRRWKVNLNGKLMGLEHKNIKF